MNNSGSLLTGYGRDNYRVSVLLCLHWRFLGAGHSQELVMCTCSLSSDNSHDWVVKRQNLRFQHTLFCGRPVPLSHLVRKQQSNDFGLSVPSQILEVSIFLWLGTHNCLVRLDFRKGFLNQESCCRYPLP